MAKRTPVKKPVNKAPIPVINKTRSDTINLDDGYSFLVFTGDEGSAHVNTPPNVAFPTGWWCYIYNATDVSSLNVVDESSFTYTVLDSTTEVKIRGTALLIKVNPNTWVITGDLNAN